jgi:hypothetical protein
MPDQAKRQKVRLPERLEEKRPRKLLAIDGGGIRSVLSLQILAEIESLLREETSNSDYRLADYFDYVAGTSTGAIIAAGVSLGMPVGEILDFYLKNGSDMFDKASIVRRLQYKYESEPLAQQLKNAFGSLTTLGSLRHFCLLYCETPQQILHGQSRITLSPNIMTRPTWTITSNCRSGSSCVPAPRHLLFFLPKS